MLSRAGYPVTVITPNYGAKSREIVSGVEILRFPFRIKLAESGQQVHPRWLSNPYYHWHLARQILGLLRDREVLCIHAQNTHSVVGSYLAAHRLALPLVAHVRDMNAICALGATCLLERETQYPPASCSVYQHMRCYLQRSVPLYAPDSRLARRLAGLLSSLPANYLDFQWRRQAYHRAARIVFASHGLRELCERVGHLSSSVNHRVIYAPVLEESVPSGRESLERLPQELLRIKQQGNRVILYVGKVSKGKGSDILFRAHRQLLQRLPDVHRVVAGNVNRSAWDYEPSRTLLLGFVGRDQLRALYQTCDVVAAPSTWPEPLGWATLEAGQHSKPIVATRVGGIPEAVVDGVTGLLVDRLDAEGLQQALYELLCDEDRRGQMGRRAHEFVLSKFGEQAVKSQLESLYRDVH
jgi:glycosyltransferase involved in cell wall biosynthesis